MYLKGGPLSKGYFTVAKQADVALLGSGKPEGDLVLRDPASGKRWSVRTNFKVTGAVHSRYITAICKSGCVDARHRKSILACTPRYPSIHNPNAHPCV